jgi:hypothetical protein
MWRFVSLCRRTLFLSRSFRGGRTISWEFKGKDYELDEKTDKVYAEDEDGEYELVGYRKTREVEVMTKKGKKIKKEVYIDEPWKN